MTSAQQEVGNFGRHISKTRALHVHHTFFVNLFAICARLRGVYMTPGRLSRRGEFTPVPSHGSTFVYMIPPQKVMPARVASA